MILALCMDDRGGMSFNGRRQSMDRAVRRDLLLEAGDAPLWVSGYTARQFDPDPRLRVCDAPEEEAGAREVCFLELGDPMPLLARAEKLILYRWNRRYPAESTYALPPAGWKLLSQVEFPGHSHPRITKEVYLP